MAETTENVAPPTAGSVAAAVASKVNAPAAETAATETPAAPAVKAENADLKHAQLQRRLADQERAIRKEHASRKQLETQLAEARAKAEKYDAGEVADYDKLTERILRGEPKPKPEELAVKKADDAAKGIEQLRAELKAEKDAFVEKQYLTQLEQEIAKREDLAHLSWLPGQTKQLADRIKAFRAEYGESTEEDHNRIAVELEQENAAAVEKQLRAGYKKVPALKKLILELAKDLGATSETAQPDQRESQGRGSDASVRPSTTLPSRASGVSDRTGPPPLTASERRDRAIARVKEQLAAKH